MQKYLNDLLLLTQEFIVLKALETFWRKTKQAWISLLFRSSFLWLRYIILLKDACEREKKKCFSFYH